MRAAPGQVVAGRYRVTDRPVGVGVLARDVRSGETVLLTPLELPEVVGPGESEPEPFGVGFAGRVMDGVGEVRVHPRLLSGYGVFAEGELLWVAEERPAGVALAELAGPVAPYRVAELGVDLAGALRSLHDAGLTHGNVSADTVLICEDGAAMLGGLLVGAAEELLCAELGGAVPRRVYEVRADLLGPKAERWALDGGPAADCWALGVLLYRLLTGRPPYPEGDVPTLLAAVGEGLPGLMEECGPLRPLVERLLRADPAARPTAAQVRQGLAELLASAPEPFGAQAAVLLPVRRPDGPLVPRPRAGEAEVHARHAGRRSLVPPALVGPLLVGGVLVALLLALAGVVALAG